MATLTHEMRNDATALKNLAWLVRRGQFDLDAAADQLELLAGRITKRADRLATGRRVG